MLLHGLEQRTLHLGRSTVDFVGQHEVGKHRTTLHLEILLLLRVDHRTDDVGWQQVGSKLNAAIVGINELSQRLDGQCLSQTRHTLKQDVAVAEQAYEQRVNQMTLPHDDTVHARDKVGHEATFLFYPHVEFADVN